MRAKALVFDSVTGDTPVIIRKNGMVDILPIEDLGSRKSSIGKRILTDTEIYSENGFTPIKYVFSHLVSKEVYEISTFGGHVRVSGDHSVYMEDGRQAKGSELKIGDKIKQIDVPHFEEKNSITPDLAWLMGLFCAEGCIGHVKPKNETFDVRRWSIYNKDRRLLERAKNIVDGFFGLNTEIKEYKAARGVLALQTSKNKKRGLCKLLGDFFEIYCYSKLRRKKVPIQIINGSEEVKKAFIDGYFAGDGYENDSTMNYGSKDHCLLLGIWLILKDGAEKISLSKRKDQDFLRIYTCKNISGRKLRNDHPRNEINQINVVNKDRKERIFLYDIETENHTFCGGIGLNLLHNSQFDADFVESEIKNGVMVTNDKDFYLDKTRPFIMRKKRFLSRILGESVMPVYLMKWNTLIPAHFEIKDSKAAPLIEQLKHVTDKKLKRELEHAIEDDATLGQREFIFRELVPAEIKFPDVYKKKEVDADGKVTEKIITPELLNSISDMRFLKGFKNYAGGGASNKKNMMNVIFVGGVIAFIFIAMLIGGVVKFS